MFGSIGKSRTFALEIETTLLNSTTEAVMN